MKVFETKWPQKYYNNRLEALTLRKALIAFALLLFQILPAYADQMGPIGSELYEEGTLSYGGSLFEIIFSWSVDEPVSSGVLVVTYPHIFIIL